jgi:TolB-like protein
MPLVNMISDPSEEYFADGMTEELISAVSKVRELDVISHTSVMQYKNKTKHVAEIARELNVGTLLEGSVRKSGNRVRTAVQLIDASSDKHLWVENYDRTLEDVFSIQSDIAQSVDIRKPGGEGQGVRVAREGLRRAFRLSSYRLR